MPSASRNYRRHGHQGGSGQESFITESSNSIARNSQALLTVEPHQAASTVFVRDLPFFCKDPHLREFIQATLNCSVDAIQEAQVRYSQKDWKTMQVAVVIFRDEDTAQRAINTLHGVRFEGRNIR